jgi:hypothetical protein
MIFGNPHALGRKLCSFGNFGTRLLLSMLGWDEFQILSTKHASCVKLRKKKLPSIAFGIVR